MKTKTTQREKAGGDRKLVRTNPKDMASLGVLSQNIDGGDGSTSDVAATTGENREDDGEGNDATNNRRKSGSITLLEEVRRNVRARRNRRTRTGARSAMSDIAPYYGFDLDHGNMRNYSRRSRRSNRGNASLAYHRRPGGYLRGKMVDSTWHETVNDKRPARLSEFLMYQLAMAKFNGFKPISIRPPARVCDLLAEDEKEGAEEVKGKVELLLRHAKMLKIFRHRD